MTYKQKLYRQNPEYRQRCIANTRRRHQERLADPVYARLVSVRKKIVDRRDSIDKYLTKITRLEKDLLKLIAERDGLVARTKKR
jgi:hypothetical protein